MNVFAALRKTMLRAHRQAWAWQDEWHGLTMDDIREIERKTQEALKEKMGNEEQSEESGEEDPNGKLVIILMDKSQNVENCLPDHLLRKI